jgi:hypothetical protein
MAAVAKNPKFAKKAGVSQSVGKDFHEADKKVGKWEHPMKKAKGGAIELGAGLSNMKGLKSPRMPSTGMRYSKNRLENVGSQLNHLIHLQSPKVKKFARGGRMSLPNTLNQVGQSVGNASNVLAGLQNRKQSLPVNRPAMAAGGKVGITESALRAISDALDHLANRDSASAVNALRSSREAIANPDVAAAAGALRSSAGVKPGTATLQKIMEDNVNANRPKVLASGGAVHSCPHCGESLD